MLVFAVVTVLAVQGAFASCGVRPGSSSRIVGGAEAQPHSWPWQASLRVGTFHICGASIINERWLVTAAHCVDSYSASRLSIVVGDHHKRESQASEVRHSLSRVIMHELYDGDSLATNGLPYDIALLEVSTPMTFNQYVQPACLPADETLDLAGNNDCWITGWGRTQGEQDENVLQELNIEVLTNQACTRVWGSRYIHDSHVCVGNGVTGACNGDSGGPLICNVDGRFTVAGAASWVASGCQTAGYPSVYTRVSSYLGWINGHIQ